MSEQLEVYNQQQEFDYAQLDGDTEQFLRAKETEIKLIVTNTATEIGRILKDAQDRLANNKNGIFQKWTESLGITFQTAHNLINRYNYIIKNFDNINLIENIPLSLTYDISRPSANPDLVSKVLDGDIKTHKEYKELEKRYNDAQIYIQSKERTIESLMSNPKTIENPDTVRRLKEYELQIKELNGKLAKSKELELKKSEIEKIYKEIESLKEKKSEGIRQMRNLQEVFKFISDAKDFIHKSMLHIPTLIIPPDEPTQHIQSELVNIIKLLNNWIDTIKLQFKIKGDL